jgi:hypothetical protein
MSPLREAKSQCSKQKKETLNRGICVRANELVSIICVATKFFFFAGTPNTAAHSPVKNSTTGNLGKFFRSARGARYEISARELLF